MYSHFLFSCISIIIYHSFIFISWRKWNTGHKPRGDLQLEKHLTKWSVKRGDESQLWVCSFKAHRTQDPGRNESGEVWWRRHQTVLRCTIPLQSLHDSFYSRLKSISLCGSECLQVGDAVSVPRTKPDVHRLPPFAHPTLSIPDTK